MCCAGLPATQQPVIILREDGQIAAGDGLESFSSSLQQTVLNALPNITTLRSWVVGLPEDQQPGAVGTFPLAQGAAASDFPELVVSPIVASDAVRGYSILLRSTVNSGQPLTSVEEIGVVQCAAASALEWAKQNAVDVAEERMRATFVDELLAAEIADEQAWIQRGASLDYDLTRPHAAWMVEGKNIADWPAPLLRFLEESGVSAPYSRREEGVLLFWPLDNPKSAPRIEIDRCRICRAISSP